MGKVKRCCPVCQHDDVEPVYENAMAPIGGYDMSYDVGRCKECGLFFAYALADDPTFGNYYQSVSKYDVADDISALDQIRINAAVNICQDHIPYDAMVVDLGCGFGALLSRLKKAGWSSLYGIDPAPNSAERAHQLFGLDKIYCGTMVDAHKLLPLDQAELVCITAVLEHLPHLRTDMSDLLVKIRLGCRILVEVPALERFSGLNTEPFGEFSLEHIQFLSITSLKNLFGSLGADLLSFEYVDLPAGAADSLFALFEFTGKVAIPFKHEQENCNVMSQYVSNSKQHLENALARVPNKTIVIYGAGSHTARLLPYIERLPEVTIVAVVDSNPNLVNKTIGKWIIQAPSVIASLPDAHVLVSSFRFQNEIAAGLRNGYPNQLILLYE